MKGHGWIWLVVALSGCRELEQPSPVHGALDRRVLHVSVHGDDAWTGRLAEPNRNRTDGPLATLAGARDTLRTLRSQFGEAGPFRVLIHGGTYELADAFVLAPEDGAHALPNEEMLSTEAHVVYEAFEDDRPVISGGRRLTGWIVGDDGRWTLTIPEVARGEWYFEQLYVDGVRRPRPRLPEQGYFMIAGAVPPTDAAKGKGYDRFRFKEGDLSATVSMRADSSTLADVEVLCFHLWTMSRMRIASIDESEHVVTFTGPTCANDSWAALPEGHRFLVENVREELKHPGEWYLDRQSGVLTYIPMPGEDPHETEVVAPRLENLVELGIETGGKARDAHGSGDSGFVEGVMFRGLTFAYTSWQVPPTGWSFPQAEVASAAAISAVNVRDCAFENCTVEHTGAWAIELGAGCKRDRIEGCELVDLGAGGIKIGETRIREDDADVASDDVVRDCLIAHGGRVQPAAVGVWIGQSHDDTIEHDDIADFYYTGVSVGWTWGYGKSLAHHNKIVSNRIAHIGQGVLSDLGGIYTLGVSPGTSLAYNEIHDVESFDYGGWGIYPDEGSSQLSIQHNIVSHTKSASFHQHYGRENLVANNVFAFGRDAQLMRTRTEDHDSFTIRSNIVYWNTGVLLGSNWSGDRFHMDDNVYWNAAGKPFDFAGASLEEWRKRGHDVHSVIADPLFVDPEHGDFRLRPESPALKLGFEEWSSVSPAGRRPQSSDVEPWPRAFP